MSNAIIFKNSIILYARLIVTSLLGIITSRIVLNALGVEDFGLYAVVGGVVLMMSLLNTVLISTSFRFIAFEMGKKDSGKVNEIFNISLALHIAMALLLLILAETLGTFYIENYLKVQSGQIHEALFVFRLSVLAALFSIVSIPFQGLMTAKEDFFARAVIEILAGLAKLIAAFCIISFKGNRLIFYTELMLVASSIGPVAFILYSKITYGALTVFKISKNWKTYKEFFKFSSWIMFGAAASIGKIQGTALVINSFFGTVLNAAFGLANQMNTFLIMFAQNIGQAAIPQITKNYSGGNLGRSKNLTAAISKFSFFLMLIPAVPILLYTELILRIWLKELPEFVVIFCKLMIINALIDCSNAGVAAAIHATGNIKYYQIILSCNTLLALPISYCLFKYNFSPPTIILVFISISIINSIISQFFLKFVVGFKMMDYFKKVYLGIIAVLISLIPIYFLSSYFENKLYSLVIFSTISTTWILLSVFLVGLTKEEKNGLKGLLMKLMGKIKINHVYY